MGTTFQYCRVVFWAHLFSGEPDLSAALWWLWISSSHDRHVLASPRGGQAQRLHSSCVPAIPHLGPRAPTRLCAVGLSQTCDVSGHPLVALTRLLTHRRLSSANPRCQRRTGSRPSVTHVAQHCAAEVWVHPVV